MGLEEMGIYHLKMFGDKIRFKLFETTRYTIQYDINTEKLEFSKDLFEWQETIYFERQIQKMLVPHIRRIKLERLKDIKDEQ